MKWSDKKSQSSLISHENWKKNLKQKLSWHLKLLALNSNYFKHYAQILMQKKWRKIFFGFLCEWLDSQPSAFDSLSVGTQNVARYMSYWLMKSEHKNTAFEPSYSCFKILTSKASPGQPKSQNSKKIIFACSWDKIAYSECISKNIG